MDLKLPGEAGAYELRYILEAAGGRRVLARAPLTIDTPARATLAAPARVKAGAPVVIRWTGPNGKGDYIDIAPAGRAEAGARAPTPTPAGPAKPSR